MSEIALVINVNNIWTWKNTESVLFIKPVETLDCFY